MKNLTLTLAQPKLTTIAQEFEAATAAELADTCTKLVLVWSAPFLDGEVEAIKSIVTSFEESGHMPEPHRQRLVGIVLRLLAPVSN